MAKVKNNQKAASKINKSSEENYEKQPKIDKNKNAAGQLKKGAPKKVAAKEADKGPNFIQKTRQFFREVRVELKKVTWPSRKETLASTSVVLVLVFLVAVFLGLVDIGLAKVMKLLLP